MRRRGSIARQIEQSPSHELDQLLKGVPGVQLFRRSDARSGHPTSQGVTLRALGGNASSRALLVLDGVPQADPFGGWVNWPAYDPASLAGIRVVRGGGSVGNGPGALAGTIEMTSRTDAGAGGEVDGGSRDSSRRERGLGVRHGRRGAGLVRADEPRRRLRADHAATRGPADKRAPYERMEHARALGRAARPRCGGAGEPRWLSRLADARDGLQRRPHERRRCVAAAGGRRGAGAGARSAIGNGATS